MSDCCDSDGAPPGDSGGKQRNVLFYACSGGANVAEAADRAARELMCAGEGTMFCLAGIGAGMEAMVQRARDADLNVVIDGCALDCAKSIFANAGLGNTVQFRVTDLGIEKVKGLRATDEQVETVIARARGVLAGDA